MSWFDPAFFVDRVLPGLNEGLLMSLALIAPSASIGFVLGVAAGVARVFGPRWLRAAGDAFATVFRGVPLVDRKSVV